MSDGSFTRPPLAIMCCVILVLPGVSSADAWIFGASFLAGALFALDAFLKRRCDPELRPGFLPPPAPAPLVSVLVAARNEERAITGCVESLLAQGYRDLEVIVIDDQSEDATASLVETMAQRDSRLHLLRGTPLPEGWLGKPHAVQQGFRRARGEWLLITDADTRHHPDGVAQAVAYAQRRRLGMLSLAARQVCGSLGEIAFQPPILIMLDRRHAFARVNDAQNARISSNGQFQLIHRDAFEAIGGYTACPAELPTDVALARRVKSLGLGYHFAWGARLVSTRMGESGADIHRSWRKNLVPILRRAGWRSLIESLLFLATCYLAPTLLGLGLVARALLVNDGPQTRPLPALIAATMLYVGHAALHGLLCAWHRFPWCYGLLFPLQGAAATLTTLASAWRRWFPGSLAWKGRPLA